KRHCRDRAQHEHAHLRVGAYRAWRRNDLHTHELLRTGQELRQHRGWLRRDAQLWDLHSTPEMRRGRGGQRLPRSELQAAENCGSIADGCGGTLNCGTCTAPQTCGGGGVANVCGAAACTPTTCAAQGKNCGTIADGCGGTLGCGVCTAPQTCGGGGVPNVCGAAATTATLTLTATGRGG